MQKVNLSADQVQAELELLKFYNSAEKCFALYGNAGSGKTYTIAHFLKSLEFVLTPNEICVCAPTNKAASILAESISNFGLDHDVLTIHNLLNLKPNLNIMELDLRDLSFLEATGVTLKLKLLICDEGSMINDDLFDKLIERYANRGCQIIFLVDPKQLQPVNNNKLSKVCYLTNKYQLSTNHRQDNFELSQLIDKARVKLITEFPKVEWCTTYEQDWKLFLKEAIIDFDVIHQIPVPNFCKVLSYTNDRVNSFNKIIHRHLSEGEEYIKGEVLTCLENHKGEGFINCRDYVIQSVTPTELLFKTPVNVSLPAFDITFVGGHRVKLVSSIVDNPTRELLASSIEELREEAIKDKKKWSKYYTYTSRIFTPFNLYKDNRLIKKQSFDYGYALSIHKSQSSTYDIVYLDNQSLQYCYNSEERRQLQYVGLSRCKSKLHILE